MYWQIELIIFLFLISTAIISLRVKDLIAAVVTLGVYSFLSALLFAVMGAVDVGFTEAVVGAGATTVFFLIAIHRTTRRTTD